MLVKPGIYKARVISHGISETSKGYPQAVVSFSFDVDGHQYQMNWYGYFTEKSVPHTIKALIACGLKGNNPAGALDVGKEVSITVEQEKDDKDQWRSKIRWVNEIGVVRNVIPQDMAKAKLSSLEGAVMAARQKLNKPDDSDEIPF